MEYGFVGFCGKDDKELSGLLKESNNIDYLGLRKMNVRLSNIMFPFANTLMPNLVYFYYLHAIYYAVLYGEAARKENVVEDRKPTSKERDEIDELEKIISKSIRELPAAEGKGFFGDVKVRAYEKYKNSMRLIHFFESDWIPSMKENQKEKWRKEYKHTLHGYLTETDRYKFVLELKESENREETLNKKIEENPPWLCKLDYEEKKDFIRRVIDTYGEGKGTITEYSVFANIVMYYCSIKNKPSKYNNTVYSEDFVIWNYHGDIENPKKKPKKKKKDKPKNKKDILKVNFSNLGDLLDDIDRGSNAEYSKVNQSKVYEVALKYSKLQLIAKMAYNMCLFENNPEKKDEYKDKLKEKIKKYKNSGASISVTLGQDYGRVFLNNKGDKTQSDETLKSAFEFINAISNAIPNSICNKKDLDDKIVNDIINDIVTLIKDRESLILGSSSRLDSGMAFDAMGDFEDTFRWEYRPEIAKMEADESGNKKTVEDVDTADSESGKGNGDKTAANEAGGKLHNMCAKYYIYELFFEE